MSMLFPLFISLEVPAAALLPQPPGSIACTLPLQIRPSEPFAEQLLQMVLPLLHASITASRLAPLPTPPLIPVPG